MTIDKYININCINYQQICKGLLTCNKPIVLLADFNWQWNK